MTYDQFWNEDVCLAKHYRRADEMRQRRKNQELWLQGMYFYQALCGVSPVLHAFAKSGTTPAPYLDRPFPITQGEVNERQAEKMREQTECFRALAEAKQLEKQLKEADNGYHD